VAGHAAVEGYPDQVNTTRSADSSGDSEKWAAAGLRIASTQLTAETITQRVGLNPTRSFAKGTLMSERDPSSRRRTEHLWLLESGEPPEAPMADHLAALRVLIEPRRDALRRLGPAVSIDLFLGWTQSSSQGSFTIDGPMTQLLGGIRASVVFDLYRE
jgi:hypothetical protein